MGRHRHRLAALALLLTMAMPCTANDLQCRLSVPATGVAGQALMLQLSLYNAGSQDLQLLRWNTPFEGRWAGAFVSLRREGQPVAYRGPLVKRGDPDAASYLLLPAGQTASAQLDLALPFALDRPGTYALHPLLQLLDVQPAGAAPRPRAAHQPQALDCAPLSFALMAAG
jgi:hypothetical protein